MDPLARPIFVVSPPGSGGALVGASLGTAPGVWTTSDEPKAEALLDDGDGPDQADQIRRRLEQRFGERDDSRPPPDAEPRLLDASPGNALRVPVLEAVFPDAIFVYVSRRPDEALTQVLGDRAAAGEEASAESVVTDWVQSATTLLDTLEALGPERWCVTDFQALIRDPATELQRLCDFLGIGWHARMSVPFARIVQARARSGLPEVPAQLRALLPRADDVARRAGEWIAPAGGERKPGDSPFRSVYTASMVRLLDQLGSSLLVSTYQTGKLICIRHDEGQINTHFRDFPRPMGIALHDGRLTLATQAEVLDYRNFPPIAPKVEPQGRHDACFLPRNSHFTGDISIHEIAYAQGELWIAATAFSCLATLDAAHSFVPRWKPPFITELVAEDRCHMNGIAVVNGRPAFVTALGETNEAGGWRTDKASGGIVIDVESGETVIHGLSMPHSPRWHDDRLWLLESGKGSIATVDLDTGDVETVAELPGFTRGLAFSGDLAFVGLSQIRETATFGGLPIEKLDERLCGVWVVNVSSGDIVAFLRFEELVQEVFEVALLPGLRFPEIAERRSTAAQSTFVVPSKLQ